MRFFLLWVRELSRYFICLGFLKCVSMSFISNEIGKICFPWNRALWQCTILHVAVYTCTNCLEWNMWVFTTNIQTDISEKCVLAKSWRQEIHHWIKDPGHQNKFLYPLVYKFSVKSRQLFSQEQTTLTFFSQSRADNSYFFLPSCCCPWHPPQTECDPRRRFPGGSSPHPRGWGAGCWWRSHYCSWCPSGKTRERQEFTGYMSRSLPLKANILFSKGIKFCERRLKWKWTLLNALFSCFLHPKLVKFIIMHKAKCLS